MSERRYVWACSVCHDPNYRREPRPMYYLDERYCPTCRQQRPIISYHAEDIPVTAKSGTDTGDDR